MSADKTDKADTTVRTVKATLDLRTLSPLIVTYPGGTVQGEHGKNRSQTQKITILTGGKDHSIPVISGNSIRGALRACALQRYRAVVEQDGKVDAIDYAWHALARGGITSGKSETRFSPARERKLREDWPLLSVFGMMTSHLSLAGKLRVLYGLPAAAEIADAIATAYGVALGDDLPSIAKISDLDIAYYARTALPEEFTKPTPPPKPPQAEDEPAEGGKKAPEGFSPMPFETEIVHAGTRFISGLHIMEASEVEIGLVYAAVAEWLELDPSREESYRRLAGNTWIGLRRAAGMGHVHAQVTGENAWNAVAQYDEWFEKHTPRIQDELKNEKSELALLCRWSEPENSKAKNRKRKKKS